MPSTLGVQLHEASMLYLVNVAGLFDDLSGPLCVSTHLKGVKKKKKKTSL